MRIKGLIMPALLFVGALSGYVNIAQASETLLFHVEVYNLTQNSGNPRTLKIYHNNHELTNNLMAYGTHTLKDLHDGDVIDFFVSAGPGKSTVIIHKDMARAIRCEMVAGDRLRCMAKS